MQDATETHKAWTWTKNLAIFRIFDAGFLISALVALALWSLMPDLDARDFTLFWQAVESLVHGANPYFFSTNAVSLNSPFGLGLFWFLGALPYQTAKQLYLIFMYFSFFWSIWIGYRLFWIPASHSSILNMALLVTAIPFGMFFQVMAWGSLVVFPLIGILAFYCIDEKQNPLLAGCCLGLCLVKPHLFVLALIWILWWSIKRHKILLPLGFLMVAFLAGLIAFYLQPEIFRMYVNVYRGGLPQFAITNASIGNILYTLLQQKHIVFLFMPLIAGICLLPILQAWMRSDSLHSSIALLLPWSVFLSAYCWGHDYLVCFATSFWAAALLGDSLSRKHHNLTLLLAMGVIFTFIIGTILSPRFRFAWSFAIYGFSLAMTSAIIFYAYLPLAREKGKPSLKE